MRMEQTNINEINKMFFVIKKHGCMQIIFLLFTGNKCDSDLYWLLDNKLICKNVIRVESCNVEYIFIIFMRIFFLLWIDYIYCRKVDPFIWNLEAVLYAENCETDSFEGKVYCGIWKCDRLMFRIRLASNKNLNKQNSWFCLKFC